MDDRRPRTQATRLREQFQRAQPMLGEALLDLARLLARVRVERKWGGGGVAPDLFEPVARTRADGVRREPHTKPRCGQSLDVGEVGRRRLLAEAWKASATVRRVEQHEFDTRGLCRIGRGQGFVVTEVMELAHRRVAGSKLLAIHVLVLRRGCLPESDVRPRRASSRARPRSPLPPRDRAAFAESHESGR